MDAQRALLDELMGAARNLTEEEKRGFKEIKWNDDEVCPCYMVRFCPHDLFVNTRSDLGPCLKIHDLRLKERYGDPDVWIFAMDNQQCRRFIGKINRQHLTQLYFENSPRHDAYVPKFEAQLALFCENLVTDLDRRVRRGRERLEQEVEPAPPPPASAEKAEQLSTLEEKIKNLLEQVESLGEEGKVDEAEALMRKVEILNIEKKSLTQPQNEKLLMLTQEKKMALCEICGSFLIANDAAERVQSHVTGKQHVGYGMVRDFIAEFKAGKEKKKEEERLSREKEAEERRRQMKKEQDIRRSGSKDRDSYREPSSCRDKEREGDHHRDRSRNYESSHDRNGMGRRNGGRVDWRSRNGRDAARDRHRDRSRSRSPGRHGYKRASRSPSR